MLNAKQLITYSSVIFKHKITTNKLPTSNYNKYIPFKRRITNITIRMKIRPKSRKLKTFSQKTSLTNKNKREI